MPSSSRPGGEPGVAVGSGNTQEKHPLYRLSSNDSARSTPGADANTTGSHPSYGAPLPRLERLVSSSSSSSTTSGNPKPCREPNGMGAHDGRLAAMTAITGRSDLAEHFPDGGWGWVVVAAATCVHVLCSGIHLAFGTLFLHIRNHLLTDDIETTWLGSLGVGISLFITPFITIICRRKSPRLYGVIGGLICALGCLFLAFSNKPEQLFISHCVVMSLGSGITIATANIMVGRYFKRRREIAETILVAGSGLGTALTSLLFHQLISTIKWMHGLQCMAGLLILTIIAGALYRSASLYHPRRDVILHLKSQKKNRRDREAEKPPYLDFSALRMRSLQALMVIAAVVGIGIHVPFVLLVRTEEDAGVDASQLLLHSVYLGLGFVAGCTALGYVTIRTSAECFICRRHLVQTAAIAGGVLTLLLVMARDASAFSLYAWAYGMAAGAYYLGLKLYALELVSQQLMERAWSFLSAVQCFPFLFGAPLASYLKAAYRTDNAGYVFAGSAMVVGGLLFYSMPYFERHASNHVVLQKDSSACSSSMAAEAAALLEVDLSDGGGSCKVSNHVHCVLAARGCRGLGVGKDGGRACQGAGKERERNGGKASVLSRITEERDGGRCSADATCGTTSCTRGGNSVEQHAAKAEPSEAGGEGPSDSTFSNKTDKSSGRDSNKTDKSSGRDSSKKSKKADVRVDLFDPPSQEKESTATVSYDSDLYINLCEAQV